MTLEIIIVSLIIIGMLASLITEAMRPGLILFTAVVCMMAFGIISPNEAIAGFANKGMITVALLYLVSEGVRKSGMLDRIVFNLLPQKNCSVQKANLRFLPVVSAVSAFLNNTPVVVIFAPMIKNWAHKMHLPPTKFLIPLSYATILGGMCTLIGTSTNLVVDGMIMESISDGLITAETGGHPLGLFELSRVGLFICLVGLFYLVMIAPMLLPNHRDAEQEEEVKDLAPGMVLMEVMVTPRFPGLNRTLRDFDFYRHYGVNVRSIRRAGKPLHGDFMNTRLTKEDTLIVEADESFYKAWKDSRVFLMINRLGEVEKPMGSRKRWFSLVLVVMMILGATLGDMPAVKEMVPHLRLDMFFFAAVTTVIMAWTGMFSPRRYTKFISWDVLITIACAFAISKGMTNSGFADLIGDRIIELAQMARHSDRGIYIMLAAIYLITNLFTELITNNAAAALAFPLALSVSRTLGIDPTPFFICICFAASASFSTPIGYQTNLIVQGMGGYKFTDFLRVGLPMNIIVFILSVFLIPLFY